MSLGKLPNVRSLSSKSSTVKSIPHGLNNTLVPVRERRSRSCSALTDRDLKADVSRNRSWACGVDLGRPLGRRSNVLLFCANRVRRRLITLCENPKRLATSTCLMPAPSIPIARKRASFGRCRRCGNTCYKHKCSNAHKCNNCYICGLGC